MINKIILKWIDVYKYNKITIIEFKNDFIKNILVILSNLKYIY